MFAFRGMCYCLVCDALGLLSSVALAMAYTWFVKSLMYLNKKNVHTDFNTAFDCWLVFSELELG